MLIYFNVGTYGDLFIFVVSQLGVFPTTLLALLLFLKINNYFYNGSEAFVMQTDMMYRTQDCITYLIMLAASAEHLVPVCCHDHRAAL